MKLFWVTFRDETLSENLLGAYVVASSSLRIALFWTQGVLVDYVQVFPAVPFEEFDPVSI